jgi:hypothetical protein
LLGRSPYCYAGLNPGKITRLRPAREDEYVVEHTVPLRPNAAGDGYAPLLAPAKPMSTVFPPLAATVLSQLRLVSGTVWPASVQVPCHAELTASEAAGRGALGGPG